MGVLESFLESKGESMVQVHADCCSFLILFSKSINTMNMSIKIIIVISLVINCIGLIYSLNNYSVHVNGIKMHNSLIQNEDIYTKNIHKNVEKTKAIVNVLDELKFRHDKINKLNSTMENNYKIVAQQTKLNTILWSIVLILNIILSLIYKGADTSR